MNTTKSYSRKRQFTKRNSSNRKKTSQGVDLNKYINNGQQVKAPKAYENQYTFDELGLSSQLIERITKKGYTMPSEIQDKSIRHILNGSDLVGIAGTGTGKTAAFLIPIIEQLIQNKRENHTLIIAPTRELANQINDEFRSLTKGLDLFSTCLIGGTPVYESIRSLKRKNHVIIGTPGRLQDLSKQRAINYAQFDMLVLDEFDRMLDMGFSKEIMEINQAMINKEQTLLFSATLDPSQKKLIAEITNQPVQVKSEHTTQDTNAIEQRVIQTKGEDKFGLVKNILSDPSSSKTILFCETKRHTEQMYKLLTKERFRVEAIHGDKSQRARESALNKFRNGHINILVATDVVARGIDVSDVELVINYQAPRTYADYVHRIGRTGRAGKMGRAITLVD